MPALSPSPRIAFVRSRVHGDIVDQASRGFAEAADGQASIEFFDVPGAFELPLHVRSVAGSGRFDAVVAAGLIVDGGIYRHEFVADAVIGGLMQVQLDVDLPVFSCVLTPQQFHDHDAHRRFFHDHMNEKGREVARACLETLAARRALSIAWAADETGPRTVAVLDTTFARVDMGGLVAQRLAERCERVTVERVTVPGFKDLAAAARRAIDDGAAIVVACAMPGPEPIDAACASEASVGLQVVQAVTGTSVLEVFVHVSEALGPDGAVREDRLAEITARRCEGHADNVLRMLLDPGEMLLRAGTGRRQGAADVGALTTAATPG